MESITKLHISPNRSVATVITIFIYKYQEHKVTNIHEYILKIKKTSNYFINYIN